MRRLVGALAAGLGGLGFAISCLAFESLYWRWRPCFNEEGRCFDPMEGVVYHAQSGPVWATLAAGSALLAALGVTLIRRKRP